MPLVLKTRLSGNHPGNVGSNPTLSSILSIGNPDNRWRKLEESQDSPRQVAVEAAGGESLRVKLSLRQITPQLSNLK